MMAEFMVIKLESYTYYYTWYCIATCFKLSSNSIWEHVANFQNFPGGHAPTPHKTIPNSVIEVIMAAMSSLAVSVYGSVH